jgi:hypothetical protein
LAARLCERHDHIEEFGNGVFRHACHLGLEAIASNRLSSPIAAADRRLAQIQNPATPAVKREAEEDWGKERWRG